MLTSDDHQCSPAQRVCRLMVFGFGATTVMWLLCYVAMLQPGRIVGEGLFILVILALLTASAMASSTLSSISAGVSRGAMVGLVTALLNLLLIGSIIGGDSGGAMTIWILSLIGGSVLVGGIGGAIGAGLTLPASERLCPDNNWMAAFGGVAAAIVFLMIITGGIVTGFEAGLAVPDWPNSYGHNMLLYPLSEMVADLNSGIYYEHAHRLTGMYVGLTVITLCILLWWSRQAAWIGWLGTALLAIVIFQGVLGGLRVTGRLTMSQDPELLSPDTINGIIHGVLGQICFAGAVVLAAVTSTRWTSGPKAVSHPSGGTDRTLGWMLVVALIIQLTIGASYRHLMDDLGVKSQQAMMVLTGHIIMAVLVAGLAMLNGMRAAGSHGEVPVLKRLGFIVLILVGLQLLLGVLATIAVMIRGEGEGVPAIEVLATSAHQANGALLLAAASLLAVWYVRLLKPATA